ncbi:hypothetical protein IWX90DRAFT_507627 [Phyllosticta citrichinensis]|uniref:Uncharacterized protein n=1 Tax=Phyllosticta citrichinensis TaxID=1130410 RepID=A0ABR1XKI1_9PEZI
MASEGDGETMEELIEAIRKRSRDKAAKKRSLEEGFNNTEPTCSPATCSDWTSPTLRVKPRRHSITPRPFPGTRLQDQTEEFEIMAVTTANGLAQQMDIVEDSNESHLQFGMVKPEPESADEVVNHTNIMAQTPPVIDLGDKLNKVTSKIQRLEEKYKMLKKRHDQAAKRQRVLAKKIQQTRAAFCRKRDEEMQLQAQYDAQRKSDSAKEELLDYLTPTPDILSKIQGDFSITIENNNGKKWELAMTELKTE